MTTGGPFVHWLGVPPTACDSVKPGMRDSYSVDITAVTCERCRNWYSVNIRPLEEDGDLRLCWRCGESNASWRRRCKKCGADLA